MEEMISLLNRRKKLGITQSQMADLIGVNCNTIGKWERGENAVSPTHKQKVEEHYQVSPVDLEILCGVVRQKNKREANLIKALKRDPKGGTTINELSLSDIRSSFEDAGKKKDLVCRERVIRRAPGMPTKKDKIVNKILEL
jgi:transcriptional regulator with XRE-family HTH domain